MGILDKVKGALNKNENKIALAAINLGGLPSVLGGAYLGSKLYGMNAGAEEPTTTAKPIVANEQPQQSGFNLGGLLGGVGDWIGKNPALFTGLTTMAVGAGSGLQALESAGLGGQAYNQKQAELQRQLEFQQELATKLAPKQIGITDVNKQVDQEMDSLGLKRPQDRQAYMIKRLSGGNPTYSAGVFGIGQGVY